MDDRYVDWATRNIENISTRQNAISRVRRVEKYYNNVDPQYDEDGLEWILSELDYSANDELEGKPNPSKIVFTGDGDLRRGLSGLRSDLKRYIRFRQEIDTGGKPDQTTDLSFRYEQDLQTALIACLDQLEPGMTLAPNGKEYHVPSGRIDALAKDSNDNYVVIELKAVTAKRDVLGQIAAYMADISDETETPPRGILIAPDFDEKLISGARMIKNLKLMRYSFSFTFSDI